jgi:TetR/AcrR family transcriptional regulator, transcriptional repressor of aconitase
MPKISEEKRQVRRDQILAAAWRCFSRKGIHSTSMEEIIREAGLSAGAVYLYYKSKDELILAAISTYMDDLRQLLMPILLQDDPLDPPSLVQQITAAIIRHTRRSDVDLNKIILLCWSEAQTNPGVQNLISDFQLKYRQTLTTLVRRWQKRGDLAPEVSPEDVSKALLSFFLGFIVQSALLGQITPLTAALGMAGLLSEPTRPTPRLQ